jgi:hypothetical protein
VGKFAPGTIALLTPNGSVRQVADGIAFPNGMAVTPDNSTLIVAESYGRRLTAFEIAADGDLSNRRVWAILAAAFRTAFAWMRTVLSGTRMFPTNVACAFAKVVRCYKRLLSIAAASLACLGERTGGCCLWWLPSGMELSI